MSWHLLAETRSCVRFQTRNYIMKEKKKIL